MTSSFLSLNFSKTEFILIGLRRQLAKIHRSSTSIDTTQSARNLGFIFDEHLSFSDQISALSKSCYHHIRALRCIRPTLTFTPPKQLPPPSHTPSLTTFTLCTMVFKISNKLSPTHSECSCSNCCPGSKNPTHHSFSLA